MSLDPDLVRIDLLRTKRLLYLQYAEGSQEQKDFLYASKLSELNYLSKLAPPEIVNFIDEEYARLRKDELKNIGLSIGIGLCSAMFMYGMHQEFPLTWVWKFWYAGIAGTLFETVRHIYHMILDWRKVQPFKVEYSELSKKIEKLTNELKDIIK